ncbi:MAG: PQQ-dependent sugar dehydrogenase [Silvanigrellaceae bacterium]
MIELLLLSTAVAQTAEVKDTPPGTRIEKLMSGFDVIWGLDLFSEDEALITLKSGKLLRVDFRKNIRQEIAGTPEVSTAGQGGLLDVRLSPEYAKDNLIYLTYSKNQKNGATTALASALLKPGENKITSLRDLFVGQTDVSGGVHFGSRIAFDTGGHVFFGVGDRGERDKAQDLSRHNGKIIRLKRDGSIPRDNPFVGRKDALPETYSFGHRNPQGLYFSKRDNALYNSEHGPRGGDEINRVQKGLNYGWPVITYGREYYGPKIGDGTAKPGMEQPIKFFVPSIGPGSLIKYESGKIASFSNSFLLGALALEHLNVVSADGKQETRFLSSMAKRFRQVKESPAGNVLLTTDSGEIYRISPAK